MDPPSSSLSERERASSLHNALLLSTHGLPFENVKFYAFSRRSADGRIHRPLPVLANMSLLRNTAPHFDYLLETESKFAENILVNLDATFPSASPYTIDDHLYASDSDLEDAEPDDIGCSPSASNSEVVSETAKFEDSTINQDHEAIQPVGRAETNREDESTQSLTESASADEDREHHGRWGRVVFLPDIASKTWRAFIFYAYFGERGIYFSRLKSKQKIEGQEQQTPMHQRRLGCSPKSMYRLADKYNIPDLKKLAFEAIRLDLSPGNILDEAFSTFTSLHPDVRDMEVDYLLRNLDARAVRERFPSWIEAMEEGRLPKGASSILISVFLPNSPLPPSPQTPTAWQWAAAEQIPVPNPQQAPAAPPPAPARAVRLGRQRGGVPFRGRS
ncbi:hypothetical protein OH77DRAFT_140098 [Trametes cingulata]|nr:hypothetical protein OH77DRAFT_140098 [Trametes cingulata]